MVGTVTVGGGGGPVIPDGAKTLGIVAASTMGSVLGLAYFFMKYGGDYGEFE